MKLMDILFENRTKKDYIDSIRQTLSEFSTSCSQDSDDSDFLTIRVKDISSGDQIGEFKRFVTNSTLHKTDIVPEKVKSIVDLHDEAFAKKHNLTVKGVK
jgi:hypothetical protein